MHFGLVFMLCSLAFALGFCLAGMLATRTGEYDDPVGDYHRGLSDGFNRGLEEGRAQAHADYEPKGGAK